MTTKRLSAKRECQILAVLDRESVTKATLARRVGISPHQVGAYLAELRKVGMVDYEKGDGKWERRWYLKEAEQRC